MEQTGQSRMSVAIRILDHEKRKQKKKFQDLNGGQLAVFLFLYANQAGAKMKTADDTHNAIDGFIAIIF
jgi:hypothetical protein